MWLRQILPCQPSLFLSIVELVCNRFVRLSTRHGIHRSPLPHSIPLSHLHSLLSLPLSLGRRTKRTAAVIPLLLIYALVYGPTWCIIKLYRFIIVCHRSALLFAVVVVVIAFPERSLLCCYLIFLASLAEPQHNTQYNRQHPSRREFQRARF